MLAFALLVAISVSILPVKGATKQFNSTILSEEIIYYRNEYLSLEIVGEGEDSVVYMNIDQEIQSEDDIMFKWKLKRGGRIVPVPMQTEVHLCTLLWNEINEPKSVQSKYRMSQAFNLDRLECPIAKNTVKLVPWVLMKDHNLDANMECGKYHYELSLEKCPSFMSCSPLIIADLQVLMESDHCYS